MNLKNSLFSKLYYLILKSTLLLKLIIIIEKKSEINCPEWSNVKLFDKSGNCYEKFMGAPIGSAKKPLDQAMLFNKFKSCIEFSGISQSPDYLYNKLINIEEIKKCRKLF